MLVPEESRDRSGQWLSRDDASAYVNDALAVWRGGEKIPVGQQSGEPNISVFGPRMERGCPGSTAFGSSTVTVDSEAGGRQKDQAARSICPSHTSVQVMGRRSDHARRTGRAGGWVPEEAARPSRVIRA